MSNVAQQYTIEGLADGMSRWNATLNDRGNGLPDAGAYIPGDDGQLYRVVETASTIHTGSPGQGNYVYARVELADWSDCAEGEESSARAIISNDSEVAP